jgi:uncharacterized protein
MTAQMTGPPATLLGPVRQTVTGRDAMTAARRRGYAPDSGLSTDSMVERDLAITALGSLPAQFRPTAFSAAALVGQDELVSDLRVFATENDLDVFFHALDLDPCGTDRPDPGVLRTIADYARELGSPWITTDLAMWVRQGEKLVESLVPIPLLASVVGYVADRIKLIQDVTQMLVVGENPPYEYAVGNEDILDVMAAIAERADCALCLDVGHLHMLRLQRGAEIRRKADADLPWHRFVEMHISGVAPRDCIGGIVIADQHRWPISDKLWETFDYLLPQLTHCVTCIAESEGMAPADLASKLQAMHGHLAAAGPGR